MEIFILVLLMILVISLIKQFSLYCAIRGLLYYLGKQYGDMPDEKKIKELTTIAIKRTLNEFLGKV